MTVAVGLAALQSLKSLYEIAKDVRNSTDPEKLRVASAQMFDLALSAREQTAALQDERNNAVTEAAELRAKLARIQKFDEGAENYEREITATGTIIYREKGAGGREGTSPYFCAHCFGNKDLQIMNPAPAASTALATFPYTCPRCKASSPMPKLRPRQ